MSSSTDPALLEHYQLMARESQEEQRANDGDDDQSDLDDEGDDGDDGGILGEETTNSGAGGGSESSNQVKKCRTRRPNKVGNVRQTFTEVDPSNGVPLMPKDLAKGYFLQVAAILRDVVNINKTTLKKKETLRTQLISRLHARYEFPRDYDN
jgi:hypothetical protein